MSLYDISKWINEGEKRQLFLTVKLQLCRRKDTIRKSPFGNYQQ